jgi:MFS family permease
MTGSACTRLLLIRRYFIEHIDRERRMRIRAAGLYLSRHPDRLHEFLTRRTCPQGCPGVPFDCVACATATAIICFNFAGSAPLSSLGFAASIPGKLFNGYMMEIVGRRWTITGAFVLAVPGLLLMMTAHQMGSVSTIAFEAGTLITGFTVLSCFPAVRMYLSEQFPTALRGRGHFFGESFARIFAGVIAPFVMASHTGSAPIFFGSMVAVVTIGACVPLLLGRETLGNLEASTEALPETI